MSPLENTAEGDTLSLGERGSFYDQLGVRLFDQDDDVMTEVGCSYLNGYLHLTVNGDYARKHNTASFGWTLFREDSRPIATHSGTFPCHREERSSIRGRLLGLCAVCVTKMIQLCGHYTEFTNPTIHIMQHAESTMEHATLTRSRDGYSKFIYPQTDLSTEIQQNLKGSNVQWTKDKSPDEMVMPMAMMLALSEPSPVQEATHPSNCGVLYYNEGTPCGYLFKAVITDMLIPQVRLAHNYPNSPWEMIHSPGGDNPVRI
jgi:hypothetical protein